MIKLFNKAAIDLRFLSIYCDEGLKGLVPGIPCIPGSIFHEIGNLFLKFQGSQA